MRRTSCLPLPFHPLPHVPSPTLVFHSSHQSPLNQWCRTESQSDSFPSLLALLPTCHLLTRLSQGSSETPSVPQAHCFCFGISSGKTRGCLLGLPHRLSAYINLNQFALVPEKQLCLNKDISAICPITKFV